MEMLGPRYCNAYIPRPTEKSGYFILIIGLAKSKPSRGHVGG